MLGQGVVEMGNVSLTLGTGGFLLTTCEKVPDNLDWNVVCNSSSISGKYILEANMLTCTSAMEWFKRNFYSEEPNFYSRMNEILTEVPTGANGCLVLPYFQGRSTPDWNSDATAAFMNITLNTSREDMLKALLESICMEINNNIQSFESYVSIDKVLINGGLSKSEAFNQMQADVYGKKLLRMDNTESTAIGALMVAGITLGLYKDEKEAFDIIHSGMGAKEYIPDNEKHLVYTKLQKEMNLKYSKC
jgi:sugar (pentulose or hexulose) kinase